MIVEVICSELSVKSRATFGLVGKCKKKTKMSKKNVSDWQREQSEFLKSQKHFHNEIGSVCLIR